MVTETKPETSALKEQLVEQMKLDHLTQEEQKKVRSLLLRNLVKHDIATGAAQPIMVPMYRKAPAANDIVEAEVKKMLQMNIIEDSSSPWAAPVVLVKKPDGSMRFCVDYRKLNAVTQKLAYPMPRIDETLDTLGGCDWFSGLDMKAGYWQIELTEESV